MLPLLFLLLFAGSIRNDVPISAYMSFGNRKEFESVGKMLNGNGEISGSCVLIGKKHVLSAAHLRYTFVEGKTNFQCEFGNKKYKIKSLLPHPKYKSNSHYDIVLIELEEEVPDIAPAKLNDRYGELGKKGASIGYGSIIIAEFSGMKVNRGHKLGGMNMIDSLGGSIDSVSGQKIQLFADFDHPKDPTCCNVIGNSKPLSLEYGTSGGDSGGGLFIKENGKWLLAGIVKGSANLKIDTYGTLSKWTRVACFTKWISTHMKEGQPAGGT